MHIRILALTIAFIGTTFGAELATGTFSPTFLWMHSGLYKPTKMVEISVKDGKVITKEGETPMKSALQLGSGKIMYVNPGQAPIEMKMKVIDVRNTSLLYYIPNDDGISSQSIISLDIVDSGKTLVLRDTQSTYGVYYLFEKIAE
jgi:hypothetical protein